MCTTACACGCGNTTCQCAPAVHSVQTGTVTPTEEVERCTECGGAASLVHVTTPAGRVLRAQFCRRCDRSPLGARLMREKRGHL